MVQSPVSWINFYRQSRSKESKRFTIQWKFMFTNMEECYITKYWKECIYIISIPTNQKAAWSEFAESAMYTCDVCLSGNKKKTFLDKTWMKRVSFFLLQKPVGKSFINFERKPKKVEIDYRVWRHQTDLRIKCSSRKNFYTSATFLGILEVHLRKTF